MEMVINCIHSGLCEDTVKMGVSYLRYDEETNLTLKERLQFTSKDDNNKLLCVCSSLCLLIVVL